MGWSWVQQEEKDGYDTAWVLGPGLAGLQEGKKITIPFICPNSPRDSPEDGGDSGRNTTHDTPGHRGRLGNCREKVHSQTPHTPGVPVDPKVSWSGLRQVPYERRRVPR